MEVNENLEKKDWWTPNWSYYGAPYETSIDFKGEGLECLHFIQDHTVEYREVYLLTSSGAECDF